jgi:hypothetical protein
MVYPPLIYQPFANELKEEQSYNLIGKEQVQAKLDSLEIGSGSNLKK